MASDHRVLGASAAQAYYDRFGKKQDSQGFYEDPALDDLLTHADFQHGDRVFEFGCGTGKLAARLFEQCLSDSATYLGCDISPVMVGLAQSRLAPYGERAHVVRSEGDIRFPVPAQSVDRVVSSYVLDLLSVKDIGRFLGEAHRVLKPGGRVCLASLTRGVTVPSRLISFLWTSAFRLSPALVGGCRPIHLEAFVDPTRWQVLHRRVVTPFGVPSEVLILCARPADTAPGHAAGVQPDGPDSTGSPHR